MTKDETNRQTRTGLGRRTYLKAATGIAGLAALGKSAASTDYEEIVVGSGETYRKSLSDGESWENVLIDITAPGAGYSITATADDWEIRNIGIRGAWDSDPGSQRFIVRTDSADANGLVENVYLGDGTQGGNDPGGMFVHARHAGTVTIRNCNIQGFPDNGIYGSAPGVSHGNGGVVQIENTYVADCGSSGLRIGTDGSYVKNCVAWDCDRGLWCLFEDLEAIDSDFGQNGHDIRVGSGSQESGGPYGELTVDTVRWGSTDLERSQNAIHGSSAGTPNHRSPDALGAPTSPEVAASGSESAGDEPNPEPEPEPEPDPEPENPDEADLVAFITEPDAAYAEYDLTVDGDLVPTEASYDSPSGGWIAAHRETVEEVDGLSRVSSLTGGGQGDAYEVSGSVRSVNVDQPDAMWIELNGEEVSEAELIARTSEDDEDNSPEFRTLEVAGQFDYRVEVSGQIRPAEDHERWLTEGEAYGDDWAEWWLSGSDSARTVWEFTGEITNLEIEDHDDETEIRTLAVDGEELDHSKYVDTGPHRLEVAGQFAYRVEVSGEIRPTDAHARWLTEGEAYGDDWAEWWLSGSDSARTVWEFTGEITNLEIEDHGGVTNVRTLTVDGEPVEEI